MYIRGLLSGRDVLIDRCPDGWGVLIDRHPDGWGVLIAKELDYQEQCCAQKG